MKSSAANKYLIFFNISVLCYSHRCSNAHLHQYNFARKLITGTLFINIIIYSILKNSIYNPSIPKGFYTTLSDVTTWTITIVFHYLIKRDDEIAPFFFATAKKLFRNCGIIFSQLRLKIKPLKY